MIKKSNQKLKTNSNETVWVAYHASRNAITLIALVITIIVLLILAGVTINLVLGPEGLLKQAQDATDKYKQAENEEVNSMSNLLAQLEVINNGTGGGTPSEPDNPDKPVDPNTAKPGDIIKTENNIKYTSDGEGNVIPVPEGFSYAGEGTKETGFVIRNDVDLNEFVWIPTDLVEYKTYEWNKGWVMTAFREYYTSNSEENTMRINDITKSVNDHKGYYISRYEAGIKERKSGVGLKPTDYLKPIFRATEESVPLLTYTYVTWDVALYLGDNLYNKERGDCVNSALINARSWDTALRFIETVGEDKDEMYPIDSIGKGWYKDNVSGNSNYEIGKPVDLMISNKRKNIYDMGGNASEWTADVRTTEQYKYAARRRTELG